VVVTVTNMTDALLRETRRKAGRRAEAAGLDVLLDDRDERAGVNSRMRTWWAFPTVSTWAKKPPKVMWNL